MGSQPITLLLDAARRGEPAAANALFSEVYAELKSIARSQRRRWRGNETLNTTALIHEAFVKLSANDRRSYVNRAHFYATASKAMRHVLMNYATQQNAMKRGGDAVRVPLEDTHLDTNASAEELLALNQLLERLEQRDPRGCQIVECRVFGGMSVEETAEALGISVATVKRDWQAARDWLYRELGSPQPGNS
ncbi:MAG: sigma-70 family RNA polymerase sigma factor [Steroidobacteraceae bacterium]